MLIILFRYVLIAINSIVIFVNLALIVVISIHLPKQVKNIANEKPRKRRGRNSHDRTF